MQHSNRADIFIQIRQTFLCGKILRHLYNCLVNMLLPLYFSMFYSLWIHFPKSLMYFKQKVTIKITCMQ